MSPSSGPPGALPCVPASLYGVVLSLVPSRVGRPVAIPRSHDLSHSHVLEVMGVLSVSDLIVHSVVPQALPDENDASHKVNLGAVEGVPLPFPWED